jgi:hypothetical protein
MTASVGLSRIAKFYNRVYTAEAGRQRVESLKNSESIYRPWRESVVARKMAIDLSDPNQVNKFYMEIYNEAQAKFKLRPSEVDDLLKDMI